MSKEETGSYKLKKEWPDFGACAGQIIEIERASFSVPWSENAFEEELKRDISNLWAVVSEQKIYAYICFWMFDREIHILNFAVHPEKRRQGLGRHLLMSIIEAASAGGIENIWLEVRPSNRPALSMYKGFGFSDAGRRKAYYSDSQEDAIVMTLNLTKGAVYNIRD